jgi:indole-3-glycerol phosphate synthase
VILDEILASVRDRAAERARRRPLRAVERAAASAPAPRGFAAAVASAPGGLGLVAELKKASPSAGLLRADFDVPSLAAAFARGGADALSVLTEQDRFQGRLENLEEAAEAGLPRLQKDFVQDEYQVLEGRAHGADAVLLIAEALAPERRVRLAMLALDLGMDVLVEAHAPALWRRAATLAERAPERVLVGINNRDLSTFEVDLGTSLHALRELPRGLLVVAESGIRSGADLQRLRDAGARGALVGESLVRAAEPEKAVRELLAGLRGETST